MICQHTPALYFHTPATSTFEKWAQNLLAQAAHAGLSLTPEATRAMLARVMDVQDWTSLVNLEDALSGIKSILEPEDEERVCGGNIHKLNIRAKQIKKIFRELGAEIPLNKAKEVLASIMGFKDWNTLIAKAKTGSRAVYLGPDDYSPLPVVPWLGFEGDVKKLGVGIYEVFANHGGIMVRKCVALKKLSDAAIRPASDVEDFYCYNEDSYNIVLLEMPELWEAYYSDHKPVTLQDMIENKEIFNAIDPPGLLTGQPLDMMALEYDEHGLRKDIKERFLRESKGTREELLDAIESGYPEYLVETGTRLIPDPSLFPETDFLDYLPKSDFIFESKWTHDRDIVKVRTGYRKWHYVLGSSLDWDRCNGKDLPRLSACIEVDPPKVIRVI